MDGYFKNWKGVKEIGKNKRMVPKSGHDKYRIISLFRTGSIYTHDDQEHTKYWIGVRDTSLRPGYLVLRTYSYKSNGRMAVNIHKYLFIKDLN